MPVYHFTFHAYRSWRPDHRRGHTEKGEGYQPRDEVMAEQYDRAARQYPVEFDRSVQKEILALTYSICEAERWRLEGAGFDPTHTHMVVSWDAFYPWEEVDRRLKNLLALKLNRRHNTPGKRWFARRHGAPRRVMDRARLDYLLDTYLPDHPGVFWKRGMVNPVLE